MDWLSSVFRSDKCKYPIKRDDTGRSTRARAFEFFEEGKRPGELPDLGVSVRTLCRYYQDWKHLERNRMVRSWMVGVRINSQLQEEVALAFGLRVDEIGDAFTRRNPLAALQRTVNALVPPLLKRLEELTPVEVERLGKLLHAYRGKYKTDFVIAFASWAQVNLRKRSTPEPMQQVCLAALTYLESDLAELREQRAMNAEMMEMLLAAARSNAPDRYREDSRVLATSTSDGKFADLALLRADPAGPTCGRP